MNNDPKTKLEAILGVLFFFLLGGLALLTFTGWVQHYLR